MSLLAQITNPVLSNYGTGGQAAAPGFLAQLVAVLWRTALILGGLGAFIFLILGGVDWLTAGGDKEKVAKARLRIVNALIGLSLIFISAAFIGFLGARFEFDILNPTLPTPAESGGPAPMGPPTTDLDTPG